MKRKSLAVGVALAFALVGCDKSYDSYAPTDSPSVADSPNFGDPTTTSPQIEDYTGQNLASAENSALNLGLTWDVYDATDQGRESVSPDQWTVCSQDPSYGSVEDTLSITFNVVMVGEDCSDPQANVSGGDDSSDIGGVATDPTDDSSSSGGDASSSSGSTDTSGGATALCNDGTLSYSAHHRGTCSHHHGVAVWY